MRRSKEFWEHLSETERSELIMLERGDKVYGRGSGYLPEGYSECGSCSTPTSGGGLCSPCLDRLVTLIEKAENKI